MNRELYKNQTLKNRKKKHMQIQDLCKNNRYVKQYEYEDKGYVALSPPNLETITKKRHKTVSTCATMSSQQFEEANA